MPAGVKRKRLVALILGVALVVTFGAFVVSGDIGEPSIPDGAVAVVEDAPDGTITDEEFQTGLEQAAFNSQLKEVPPPDDPQYEQISQSAIANAIQTRWVKGEAEDRGITVTDREIDQAFQTIVEQQLGGQKGYEKFLADSPFDEQAVRDVAELTAISDRLQSEAIPEEAPDVSDDQVEQYYEANIAQFEQPETRDVRVILNPDASKIEQAKAELEQDDSPESWDKVAKEFSTDEATKNDGGLRQDVAQGQNEPALDDAIFSAAQGSLVGPIEGESGSYLIEVEKITPGQTTPLDQVSDQIRQSLQQGLQSQTVESFRTDFIDKWTARTFCSEDVAVELCANAPPPPETCTIDDEEERSQADPAALEAGCPAPAAPRSVVNPGTGNLFPGEQAPVLPQGPIKPAAAAPTGLPPGVSPLGPTGAPPTGAPPQGTAPAAP